jgi:hypothetical protein
LRKGLKNELLLLFGDADAGIANDEVRCHTFGIEAQGFRLVFGIDPDLQHDFAALGEFQGVA